jgi:hypothetical protein
MRGHNTIKVNTATAIEAFEYYLNNVVLSRKVKVTSIDKTSTYEGLFEVSVQEAEADLEDD